MADIGAIAALDQLGELTATARSTLDGIGRPVVVGGEKPVGHIEPRLVLQR